ncbi:hypothetical protein GCM10007874_41180 [Labrys miyagiensis]|uniref:Uncharacterized protein n=1 Tax=Labrys miyagiensis TaxID=346912 RepID=A0ABQ6CL73_9HYPH|nr:hypothetical protein GCM10007874_41180 [Labrys miyagiensis]
MVEHDAEDLRRHRADNEDDKHLLANLGDHDHGCPLEASSSLPHCLGRKIGRCQEVDEAQSAGRRLVSWA